MGDNYKEEKHMELLFFFVGFFAGITVGVGTIFVVAIKSLGGKKDKGGDANDSTSE